MLTCLGDAGKGAGIFKVGFRSSTSSSQSSIEVETAIAHDQSGHICPRAPFDLSDNC
jgi:hypothetical protein